MPHAGENNQPDVRTRAHPHRPQDAGRGQDGEQGDPEGRPQIREKGEAAVRGRRRLRPVLPLRRAADEAGPRATYVRVGLHAPALPGFRAGPVGRETGAEGESTAVLKRCNVVSLCP